MLRRIVIATALLLLAAGVGACGSDTGLKSDLVGTEWTVVDASGFSTDGAVEGDFDFTASRFRFSDGTNFFSRDIRWTADGFDVGAGGDETLVGSDEPASPFGDFAADGAQIALMLRDDGSLALTRGEQTIVGRPTQ